MNAGDLTRVLELQQPDATAATGYRAVAVVFGAVEDLGASSEALLAGAPAALATVRVRIYYRPDIRASWRLQDQETGRVLEVAAVSDPDGSKVETRLACVQVQ